MKEPKRREQNQHLSHPQRKHTTLSEHRRKNVQDGRIFVSVIVTTITIARTFAPLRYLLLATLRDLLEKTAERNLL